MNYRNILTTLALAMLSLAATAQVGEPRHDFSIGASAGYTMNSLSFVPRIKQAQKGSPSFGFATRYVCEKYFNTICAVQVELQYNNLGWKEVIEDTDDTYYRDMHYVHVPMLMQMGWGRERKGLKFLFEAGPQLGMYLGGEEHPSNGDDGRWSPTLRPSGVNYQYALDVDNKLDYGIAGGIGMEFSNPHIGHILLEGRYYYGLGDCFDNSKRGKFGRSANQTISIKLTYLFDLVRTKGDIR